MAGSVQYRDFQGGGRRDIDGVYPGSALADGAQIVGRPHHFAGERLKAGEDHAGALRRAQDGFGVERLGDDELVPLGEALAQEPLPVRLTDAVIHI